ncbi:MAG: class I SAM-dependent methyltransferase [Flavobacteriaceae bacterium]|nr:class I SAM-dependent methyltransferase [Flavobacteriaceae bacterium]
MKIKDHFLSQEEFELQETNISGILKTYPIPENLGKYYESKNYISHHQDSGSLKEKLYKFLQKINLRYKKKVIQRAIRNQSQTSHEAQPNCTKQNFESQTILDYGCGAGEFIKFMAKDFKTYGFEPNENARNFAQRKNNKTTFLSSPTLSEIENESLDVITLWHVFEHIENQQEILEIFYQKLKPNGKLIIAVPNHTSYDARHYKEFWAAYDVPRHIFHFSKEGIFKLMNNEKWKVEKVVPLLLDSFYISILSEKYKKNPLFWLFGTIHGAISNFKALKTGEFSSLIYCVGKI